MKLDHLLYFYSQSENNDLQILKFYLPIFDNHVLKIDVCFINLERSRRTISLTCSVCQAKETPITGVPRRLRSPSTNNTHRLSRFFQRRVDELN